MFGNDQNSPITEICFGVAKRSANNSTNHIGCKDEHLHISGNGLEQHLGVEILDGAVVGGGGDVEEILDSGHHLLLRLHHLLEFQQLHRLQILLLQPLVVLRHAVHPHPLNPLVRLRVLHRRSPPGFHVQMDGAVLRRPPAVHLAC
ncbi:uncharacterized protein LOC116000004 [Ipomoea triloba]|uniref:uncharacterized protein LOC116000004 n=1 Tax=Ipomoea triloba TaxID=35885 RepID=UPI00125E4882|nr:uncharacterized protein LOC116000004 [Ipomoea triloba]